MRKIIALLIVLCAAALAQTTVGGQSSIAGAAQAGAGTSPAPFTALSTTSASFAPTPALLPGFPTVIGPAPCSSASPCPEQGYQGGQCVGPNTTYVNGICIFIPWQINAETVGHAVWIGYKGGTSGIFHCTNTTDCGNNWDYFDAATLSGSVITCPSGTGIQCPYNAASLCDLPSLGGHGSGGAGTTKCQAPGAYVGNMGQDNHGNLYAVPSLAAGHLGWSAFLRYNGGPLNSPASWDGFFTPCSSATFQMGGAVVCTGATSFPLGSPTTYSSAYGWDTAVFTGPYDPTKPGSGLIMYPPTWAPAGTQAIVNTNVVAFDTTGVPHGTYPSGNAPFTLANFIHMDLHPLDANSGSYLSSWCDGYRYCYFPPMAVPISDMARFDTMCAGGMTSSACWSFLNPINLGTSGYPQVTGNGSLLNIQGGSLRSVTYLSGASVLGAAGTTCHLSSFNQGLTGATVTATLTVANTLAGATFQINNAGSGGTYGQTTNPTAANVTSGSATCSGTAVNMTGTTVQPGAYFVGGQGIWNGTATQLWMYLAPFATNFIINNQYSAGYNTDQLYTVVARTLAGTCSGGTPGQQACSGTFTANDIFASTASWELFDLTTLTTNPAWLSAGFASPAIYGSSMPYFTSALANQPVLSAFQLQFVNMQNPLHPLIGFYPDLGMYDAEDDPSKLLNDPSGWSLAMRPESGAPTTWQGMGCMGGGYANGCMYPACPNTNPYGSMFQICGM